MNTAGKSRRLTFHFDTCWVPLICCSLLPV